MNAVSRSTTWRCHPTSAGLRAALREGGSLPDQLILKALVAPLIDPADPRAVYQRIAHDLRTQILNGDLPPGSMLPSETELVRRYGSSRGPVRQAINLLRSEGLIDSHQGRGVFVRQRPPARRLRLRAWRRGPRHPPPGNLAGSSRCVAMPCGATAAEVAHRLGLQEGARARGFRFIVEGRPARRLVHPVRPGEGHTG